MKRFKRILLRALPFFILSASSFAQTAEEESVDIRFLFLDESTPGAYETEIDGSFQKISSYPYAISAPVQVAPGEELPVFKKIDTSEGPRRVQIATVKGPTDADSVLTVLEPTNEPTKFNVAYFNSDSSRFSEGTVRVLNLGRAPVALALGEEMAIVQPGKSRILNPKPDQKNRIIARVAEKTGNDDWEIIYDSVSILRPGERMIGVFVFSPSGMRHTFTEAELEVMKKPEPGHYWLSYSESVD